MYGRGAAVTRDGEIHLHIFRECLFQTLNVVSIGGDPATFEAVSHILEFFALQDGLG